MATDVLEQIRARWADVKMYAPAPWRFLRGLGEVDDSHGNLVAEPRQTVGEAIAAAPADVAFLLAEIDRLQAKRNRVRSDWSAGEPPKCDYDKCDSKEPMHLVAHNTGDGWVWHWHCDCGYYSDEAIYEIEWPFIDDVANAADWEAAGFEVV